MRGARGCDAAISPRYPLIELGAALIGVWAGFSGASWLVVAVTAVLGWQLLLIAIIDAREFLAARRPDLAAGPRPV